MKQPVRIAAALAVLAAVATLFAAPLARSQAQPIISPSFLAIGTSSAGAASMAWFHDPSGQRVMACQAAPANGGPAVQCTIAKMP